MNLRAVTFCLATVLFASALPALAGSNSDAAQWLERMSAAMSQMTYQGTFVYVQGDEIETMRITHVADEEGVRERLVSLSGLRREILRDSNGVRWVQGEDLQVMEDSAFSRSFFPEIPLGQSDQASASYHLELGESERIAGRSGRKLKVIPKDEYRYGYTLWLEEPSALLLKWELLDSNNRWLAKLVFTELQLGSEVDVKELESTSRLKEYKILESGLPSSKGLSHSKPRWKPSKLPAGFHLTAHRYVDQQNQKIFEHLVYSDGLAAVSVYVESAASEAQEQETGISRLGTTHAYSRVTDGIRITVVGDVPAITVQSIGNAVSLTSH
ncbi:MAG: MucB/RseB C-terminal domain-containing protein [Xanthomonadales bacterium]